MDQKKKKNRGNEFITVNQRGNRSLGGLCASTTPRYQTATFRPMRAPLLPRYAPSDRMRVRIAENGVRIGRRGDALRSSTWQSLCATPWCRTRRCSWCTAISGCCSQVSESSTWGPSYHHLSRRRAAAGLKMTEQKPPSGRPENSNSVQWFFWHFTLRHATFYFASHVLTLHVGFPAQSRGNTPI